MTESRVQKEALATAARLKEENRRRVDSEEGLVWAMTRRRSWSQWIIYVEGHPRQRSVGTFTTNSLEVIKTIVDALEPLQARGLL